MSKRPSYPKKTEHSGEVLLMANLGELAVIIKPCIMCGKRTPIDSSIQLYLCSIECWLKFKELSIEIDRSYGYEY
jgi:hypothetical protein